jgi:predicted dehydrogenase
VVTLNFLGVREGRGPAEYSWRRDARVSGGGVLMDMVHAVYLAQWLMGEPIRAVNAALSQRRAGTVEDLALCRFEFESGFGLVNMAWAPRRGTGRGSLRPRSQAPVRGSLRPRSQAPVRGSLRPPAASRCSARKLAARSFPRRPPA